MSDLPEILPPDPSDRLRAAPLASRTGAATAALYALERRYLAALMVAGARLSGPPAPLDWRLDARFVQLERLGLHPTDGGAALRLGMRSLLAAMHTENQTDSTDSLVFSLSGDGRSNSLQLGVRAENAANSLAGLSGALAGHLPGSKWATVAPSTVQGSITESINGWSHLAALTGIPAFKLDDESGQGLERLIEALAGRRYQLLVIAEPISESAIQDLIGRARALGSELHGFVRRDETYSRATGTSSGESRSDEQNESTAASLGRSSGNSTQDSRAAVGSGLGMAVALAGMAAGAGAASLVLGQLVSEGAAVITGRRSQNSGDSTNDTTSRGRGSSESVSRGSSDTETMGFSREVLNKSAEAAEKLIDTLIERLQAGRALGFWNVGVYLATPDAATLALGTAQLRSLASGKTSPAEAIRAIPISAGAGDESAKNAREAILALKNPTIQFADRNAAHPLGAIYQTVGTPINSAELSLWANLPTREISGVSAAPLVHFGVNAPMLTGAERIAFGEILSANGRTGQTLDLPLDQLARHTFITGTTGAGKTNTTLAILRGLHGRSVPFLVIEPAKTEYRALLADPAIGPEFQLFTLGNETVSPFRLNPFAFVPGFGLLTHIDLLKATFNAAFPMYASMPYLLEEAILDCYTLRGWDLATGTNRHFENLETDDHERYLPTLSDLFHQIDQVVARKQYAQQLRMDLSAALKARISSLRVGSKGRMLDTVKSIPIAELLARPTVLELQDLGDDSEKAFVMGLLLTLLYEYRQVSGSAETLQHVIVIEEAHRLLKRIGTADNPEIANPQGRAVETFGNILAEVREYGEGVIVIDQIASKLAPEVIKNTNLKIIHRVLARDDRAEVGGAINLDEAQQGRLVTLRPGEAVIHADGMDQALLVQVDHTRGTLPKGSTIKGVQVAAHMKAAHAYLAAYYAESWPAAPLNERPGCAECRARCRFGGRVADAVNAQSALTALNRIGGLRDEQANVRLAALDEALEKLAGPIRRPSDNAHDLKHCLLTHLTEDESVLGRHAGFILES